MVPSLYINFHESAWPDIKHFPSDTASFMVEHTTGMDPSKIYLDVHRYIAWTYYNDEEYANDPFKAENLKKSPLILAREFQAWQDERKVFAAGRWSLACSEWSAAWSHLSSSSTPNPDWIQGLFKEQLKHTSDVEMWFWSWKIPGGMEHANFWSLRNILEQAFIT